MSISPEVRIRIIRKGNGLVQAVPAPAILQAGQPFRIANTTGEVASVTFRSDLVQPVQFRIAAGSTEVFTPGAGPAYVEFELKLASGPCAEGASQPGAIIDP